MDQKSLSHYAPGRNATADVGSGPPLEVLGFAPIGHGRTFRVRRCSVTVRALAPSRPLTNRLDQQIGLGVNQINTFKRGHGKRAPKMPLLP